MKQTKLIFIIFSIFITLGCSKKSEINLQNIQTIELLDSTSDNLSENYTQTWHTTNKRVMVLFGYNFNTPEVYEPILFELSKKFGLAENGGLILPLFYPDSFKHSPRSFFTQIANILADDAYDFCGVITLGAPENTHIAFSRNQDLWNENVPYPIIALFPQDDVLGLESSCDFVLDKTQTVNINSDFIVDEEDTVTITEAPDILYRTISYIQCLESSMKKNADLRLHVSNILKNYDFHYYKDSETGLQSINHFVLN